MEDIWVPEVYSKAEEAAGWAVSRGGKSFFVFAEPPKVGLPSLTELDDDDGVEVDKRNASSWSFVTRGDCCWWWDVLVTFAALVYVLTCLGMLTRNGVREQQSTCNTVVPAPLGIEPNTSNITKPEDSKCSA